ncbi:hypothetical protein [Hyphomicrobium sp.]|uniref:hypothetical protein n=1 Tax=Hyphomicrobium sp. TaxID=82 RepID=UPI002FE3C4D4
MFGVICATARRPLAGWVALAAFAGAVAAAPSGAAAEEIIVTVTKLHPLDKADELSAGDFFARIRVDGKAAFSPELSGQTEMSPNWRLTLPAKPGVVAVNLAVIDKDVSVDDPIDINRVPNKRDLDFTVNTRTGKIEGFAETYKTGQTITRAGTENKKARISFTVDVKK